MSKTWMLFLVISFYHLKEAIAQTCLPSGITFTTQQQIDDFAMNYPGCTEILGQVVISQQGTNDIKNSNKSSERKLI